MADESKTSTLFQNNAISKDTSICVLSSFSSRMYFTFEWQNIQNPKSYAAKLLENWKWGQFGCNSKYHNMEGA
jgi:hypothetical protein